MNESNNSVPSGNGVADKPENTSTDLAAILDDLNGGVFSQQVGRALSDVAMGVVAHGDKGKIGEVTITFKLNRIGESSQVAVRHKLAYKRPTSKGSISEDTSNETPMYVGRGGRMSLVPDTQTKFQFDA